MTKIPDMWCRSRVRDTMFLIFPPFYLIIALAIFTLPGLLVSPIMSIAWLTYGALSGDWWNPLLWLGPFLLMANLVGVLHLPMLDLLPEDTD